MPADPGARVEGHEAEVLEGAPELLGTSVHLFLDLHRDIDRKKIFTLLKDFRIYDLKNKKWIAHNEAVRASTGEIYAYK